MNGVIAQIQPKATSVKIKGVSVINPRDTPSSFAPVLKSLEAPTPGGKSYRDFVNQQKVKSAELFKSSQFKKESSQSIEFGTAPDPILVDEMSMRKYIGPIDKEDIYNGGTPLDNTMALNDQYLLASVNSFLWAYDIAGDSNLFVDDQGTTYNITFAEFGKDYITDPSIEFPFDPKLIYVPAYDKFVFIFLSGRTPNDSKAIVGFSSTSDPRDPWYVYMLPGNPRNANQWTDFPMVGFDRDHVYLTINLIHPDSSWQTGFQGSIIWQMSLEDGFTGNSDLTTTMYDDIVYGNTLIRNLTPVQPQGNDLTQQVGMTFLSNRNFDIQNDSLFIVEINDKKEVNISVKTLPVSYGVPPNGIQADDNPAVVTDGLQTNDARFLQAISYFNQQNTQFIEFVGNTMDFNTGRAGIYHGVMEIEKSLDWTLRGSIIGVDSLDFGYPNLCYVNNGANCYEGTFIGFNHTSYTTPAGVSGIWHSNHDGYSKIIRLKEGDDYVRRMSGSYERWGDYFGIQTIPSKPWELYTAGFYGTSKKSSSTWFNRIMIPDTNQMIASVNSTQDPNFPSSARVEVEAKNGFGPYTYQWSDGSNSNAVYLNLTSTDSNWVSVSDAKNCNFTADIPSLPVSANEDLVYPNPVSDYFNITFSVSENTQASFVIYDITGKLITNLGERLILKGTNLFEFSTSPLQSGVYILRIYDSSDTTLVQNTFLKL
jgi:hypothetical protein